MKPNITHDFFGWDYSDNLYDVNTLWENIQEENKQKDEQINKINEMTKDAPENLNSFKEVADKIKEIEGRVETLEMKEKGYVFAETTEDINNINDKESVDVVITSNEALAALTSPQIKFKSIALNDCDVENNVYLYASDKITLNNITVDGEKQDNVNGKVNYSAEQITVNGMTVKNGSTVYNVFEGNQKEANLKKFTATDINCDNTALKHNVFNIYMPSESAEITIENGKFNLNVENSNIMRLSNYANSDNVTITFKNIEWNYENIETAEENWNWAGLIIYQPAGKDEVLNGNFEHLKTWKFNFIDCKYNGEKVTANNFGEHSQVFYLYNVNNEKNITNPEEIEGISINFE